MYFIATVCLLWSVSKVCKIFIFSEELIESCKRPPKLNLYWFGLSPISHLHPRTKTVLNDTWWEGIARYACLPNIYKQVKMFVFKYLQFLFLRQHCVQNTKSSGYTPELVEAWTNKCSLFLWACANKHTKIAVRQDVWAGQGTSGSSSLDRSINTLVWRAG